MDPFSGIPMGAYAKSFSGRVEFQATILVDLHAQSSEFGYSMGG